MAFFADPTVSLSNKLLEIVYIIIGLITIYAGVKNLLDKKNPARFGTFVFWTSFGIVCSLGRWLPSRVSGALIIIMVIPAIFKRGQKGESNAPTKEYTQKQFARIGMKIFLPALTMGILALTFALFTQISALVGVALGVLISMIVLMCYSRDNKPVTFLKDSERLLSTMGPLCMLPQLLGALGGIFTAAGVGDIIGAIVSGIVPEGNVIAGIIVFAIGMALFTAIMGNAFGAITVMTIGVGAPCVLAYGADPVIIGMVALTCGFCGTLLTPMAANFNIVPVALLNMKERFGVIRNQAPVALIMLAVQIVYMIIFS